MLQELLKPLIGPAIEKVLDLIPNKNARARAQEELEQGILDAVAKADDAQAKINQVEAAHKSVFVAGWRPSIGWVCGLSLAYHYILQPFSVFMVVVVSRYVDVPFAVEEIPVLDTGPLMTVMLGMLGMGGLRTFEKIKGVARNV